MAAFNGFPREATALLKGLARNNNKKWFDAHRTDYNGYVLEPARAFAAAMGGQFARFAPSVVVDPCVNGSIRRINRDTRFSNDKRPYKSWLDMQFWEGQDKRCGHASYFFHMDATNLYLGVGMYEFPKEQLAAYRAAVVNDTTGRALIRALAKVTKAGYDVSGKHYKRVPRGFDPEHERADLLLHTGLFAVRSVKLPPEVYSAKLVPYCAGQYKKVLPLFDWLVESTGTAV